MPISKNSISLAGEFAVLSQLALRGFSANMTLGNTKGIDILVHNPDTDQMFQLEVKTNYASSRATPSVSKLLGKSVSSWIMNAKHEKIISPNLFYCFVHIGKSTNEFRFFIVPNEVVAKYVKRSHYLWLKVDRKHKDTSMRIFRIGLKDEKYPIPTATVEKYENNWKFTGV